MHVKLVSHYVCYIFSSNSAAERPPFEKYLLTRLNICFLCILTICDISYFPIWVFRAGFAF